MIWNDYTRWRQLTDAVVAYHIQHQPAPSELYNNQFEAYQALQHDLLIGLVSCIGVLVVSLILRIVVCLRLS